MKCKNRNTYLSQWLSQTPPELVMANIDRKLYDAIPREKAVVMPE